jgi:TonB family protein
MINYIFKKLFNIILFIFLLFTTNCLAKNINNFKDISSYINNAKNLYNSGELYKASLELEKAIQIDTNEEAFIMLGDIYFAEYDFELSISNYLNALQINDKNNCTLAKMARAEFGLASQIKESWQSKDYKNTAMDDWQKSNIDSNNNCISLSKEEKDFFINKNMKAITPQSLLNDTNSKFEQDPQFKLRELQSNVIYPEEAVKSGIQGKVVIRIFLNVQGKPTKIEIQSSSSKLLNQAAINAVKKTEFLPAMKDGKAEGVWLSIPILFQLKG